jgi:hypothetical protein
LRSPNDNAVFPYHEEVIVINSLSVFILVIAVFFACGQQSSNRTSPPLDEIAESYVKLILRIGLYDSDYVDAYYGPEEWRPGENERQDVFPYEVLSREAERILKKLADIEQESLEPIEKKRVDFLAAQLRAARTRIEILNGKTYPFDEESKYLYDAVAPTCDAAHFDTLLQKLDAKLPGKGPVSDRLTIFKKDFIIPKDKLDVVFQAAIAECRKRTLEHIELPENEDFEVEYVTGKSWSGYNWYKGNSFSLIQVNVDLPIYIGRAVDLAAHEGYPGHHVFGTTVEQHMSRARNWMEYTVYPLFSPHSLIAEGSANYGKEVVLPREERLAFERDVLFPLAGLDPGRVEAYYEVEKLTDRLNYAGNEAARNYLDGSISAAAAIDWLVDYSLLRREEAERKLRFFEQYRSYTINYNLGEDIVRNYVESNGGTPENPEKRWRLFLDLLSTPNVPSELMKAGR